jgi:hypothetical protein
MILLLAILIFEDAPDDPLETEKLYLKHDCVKKAMATSKINVKMFLLGLLGAWAGAAI